MHNITYHKPGHQESGLQKSGFNRLQQAEIFANDLEHWLSQYPESFSDDNIHRELEVLERWRDHYHRDLITLEAFQETCSILLANLHERLKLALENLQRLQADGISDEELATDGASLATFMHRIEALLNQESVTSH